MKLSGLLVLGQFVVTKYNGVCNSSCRPFGRDEHMC